MSLQLIAKQMEAKGRGGDSLLVHMTTEEVEGLQKLAESAGGSLTVNPETGLVEAFSLKRMLPAILGGALAASGVGMPLAIAGGALAGGMQAKRDDKDFLTGALMGGLGAYGGASLAGGLGAAGNAAASQAATAANPAFMGPMPGAATGLEAAKTGFSALGSETGRTAFMQGVGGIGGLAKAASAAAAPMMTEEQKMAEAPVDDEMYYYEFTPGQTGKRSNTSTEEPQFANSFSAPRKIRASEYPMLAAQGGLMSFAEGGETAAPAAEAAAPSASEVALAYLMGERSSSAGLPALASRASSAPTSNVGVGSDNMYAFDPATGTFLRNPNVAGANSAAVGSRVGTSFAGSGGSDYVDPNPGWTDKSPAEKAAWYAEHPNIANATGIAQSLFGMTPLGKMQNYFDPEGVAASRDMVSQAPAPVDNRGGMNPAGVQPVTYDFAYAGDNSGGGGWSPSENQNFGGGFDYSGDYDRAEGGLISLAKGGMASGGFVVPADVVSALGNGSTDAGLRKLNAMLGNVKPIKGKGDGLSDSIPTNIDGKQAARVADGEAYIDPKTVKRLGGAKKLYAMMDKIRDQAHGKTTQQRKVNPARVMA